MFIVQQKGEEIRAVKKDNRREEEKKRKKEEDLVGDVNVVATCYTGFVQIMPFFYFSFQFLYWSNFSFPAETSGTLRYGRYCPV